MFHISEKPKIEEIQIIYHATTHWPLSAACPLLCGKPPLKLISTNTYGPQLFLAVHLFNLINMIMSSAFPNQAKISTAFLSQVFFPEIKIVCAKEWGTGSFPLLHTIGTVHLQITC